MESTTKCLHVYPRYDTKTFNICKLKKKSVGLKMDNDFFNWGKKKGEPTAG